ncbi:MAG TPA: hypothetical protein VMT11_06565 [Myxococcaceae bacterium]|nr:hypothetical protein [Myxococcaceae bacterium]
MTPRRWAVLAAGLLGCAHGSAPPPAATPSADSAPAARMAESARYFPLAVGNRWTYEATYLGEKSTRRVEVVAFRDGSYVDRDGRALRADKEGIRDQVRYLLHEPLTAGATWTSVVAPGSAEHYRVLSVRTPCQVPAGRFTDCVEVESRTLADPATPARLLVNRVTFAAGVGIVQVRTALEEGTRSAPTAELLLTAFEVAAAR